MTSSPGFCYPYPRPALTVDLVILRVTDTGTDVLLIKRKHPPFINDWALPGGFVDEGETLKQAAYRELTEETNLSGIHIQQVGTFAAPGRDPRGWTATVAFAGYCSDSARPKADDDAAEAEWWSIKNHPSLAFDHEDIIRTALSHIRLVNSG